MQFILLLIIIVSIALFLSIISNYSNNDHEQYSNNTIYGGASLHSNYNLRKSIDEIEDNYDSIYNDIQTIVK